MTIHLTGKPGSFHPRLGAERPLHVRGRCDGRRAARLLLEQVEHEANVETPSHREENPPLTHKPIWEEILELDPRTFPMRNGTNCRSTAPSSTTNYIYGTPKSFRTNDAGVCRRRVLDRHRRPQRPVTCSCRKRDAFAGSSHAYHHRRSARPEFLTYYKRPRPDSTKRRGPDGREGFWQSLVIVRPQSHQSFLDGVRHLYKSRPDKDYSPHRLHFDGDDAPGKA